MRKMKDSGIEWIGQIPEDWKTCFVKNIANVFTGNSIKDEQKQYYEDKFDAVPYISSKDINAVLQEIDYDNGMWIKNDDDSFKRASKESTLMCIEGGSAGKKIAFTNQEVCFVNKLCCFQTKDADSKYVYYYLMSPAFTKDFFRRISGLIGGVSVGEIKKIPVVLPTSYKEQTTIATYLDRKCSEIDSIVRETEQTIEEYKKLKQSLITEVVTGKKRVAADGLSLSNEPRKMKDSGVEWIGEVPEEWEIMRLKGLGTCQNGISKSAEYFGEEYEYPFVNYTDAYNNYVVPQPKGRANSSKEDRTRYSLKEGDVLFTRTSETIEEIGYASTCMDTIENAVFSGFLIRFRPTSTELFKGYSKYYFRSSHLRRYFVKEMNLVTRASLSQQLLKGMSVLLPSLAEQHLIATYLDAKCSEIDKLIADKQTLLQELDTYKKSLIYECVTGKREIN